MADPKKPDSGYDEFMVRPDAGGLAIAASKLEHNLGEMAKGKRDPKALYRELEAQHAAMVQGNAWPGASSVKGHRRVPVVYRQRDGFHVKMQWDYLPDVGGPTVLGVCPACYYNAPTNVDTKKATKPIAVDNQLARLMGDPEADKKLVTFRISYPAFHVYLDTNNPRRPLLTITETIRCPNHYRCSFIVRVRDGIIERVSGKVTPGSKAGGPLKGPLIKVKW